MTFKLRMVNSKQAGTVFVVHKSPYAIGRHEDCDLRVRNPQVSQHHCLLVTRGEEIWVQDLHSTNGTFVNAEQVVGERQIHHGDRLRAGPAVMELVEDPADVLLAIGAEGSHDTEVGMPALSGPKTNPILQEPW